MSARLGMIFGVGDSQVDEPAVASSVPAFVACSAELRRSLSPLRVRWKRRRKGLKGLNPAMEMASCRKRRTREASPPWANGSSSETGAYRGLAVAKMQKMAPKALESFSERQNLQVVKVACVAAPQTRNRGYIAFSITRARTASGP